jgi:hypothetical protein
VPGGIRTLPAATIPRRGVRPLRKLTERVIEEMAK